MTRFFKTLWSFLRQLVDDDAYERYRAHHEQLHQQREGGLACHANEPALGRRAFYREQQLRKWNGLQSCC